MEKEIKKLVEGNALGFASVGLDGNPHCIAVGFAKVFGEKVLIADNYMTETLKNIKNNPNVAISVWNRNYEEDCKGYELKGVAEIFSEGEWLEKVKEIPENKDMPCKNAIIVSVDKIKKLA